VISLTGTGQAMQAPVSLFRPLGSISRHRSAYYWLTDFNPAYADCQFFSLALWLVLKHLYLSNIHLFSNRMPPCHKPPPRRACPERCRMAAWWAWPFNAPWWKKTSSGSDHGSSWTQGAAV